jgi:hypothetical protein
MGLEHPNRLDLLAESVTMLCRKLVTKPIKLVRCERMSKGTVGCLTHTFSIQRNAPMLMGPTMRGTRTLYESHGYAVPPQVRPRMVAVEPATKRTLLWEGMAVSVE